jgi:hypothetical protein
MESAFLGGAYTLRSTKLAGQTCINLFLEPNESGQGQKGGFYGTPGLLRKATLAALGSRQSIVAGGYLWHVVGANVYRVDSAWAATLIGTLPNSTGPVAMTQNGTQVAIAHPDGWHVITLATLAFAAVVDAPRTSDMSFIDNYGVAVLDNGTYGWTNLADLSVINPLSFASAEGDPDPAVRTLVDHRELWLMGTNTIEVAVVTADPDLPFTRTAFIEEGIYAPRSAAKEDNSVFWLGRNEKGRCIVRRAQGYVPERISTFALEQAIQSYANPANARGWTYQQDGHHFYVLQFDEATWAFDINTRLWAQRGWMDPADGTLKRHRAETHAFFADTHVVGDFEDGRLYALDMDTFTDDGDPIYRERAWQQQDAENHLITFTRGELVGEMGVGLSVAGDGDDADPQAWLSWSSDGGRTWSNEEARALGKVGAYLNRAVWWRMGASRDRYFRLRSTAPVRIAWFAFNIEAQVSAA